MTVEPLGSATLPPRDPATAAPPHGVMDMFKIGIGPSSSHTVGPMRAAATFRRQLERSPEATRVKTILRGSLAWTGKGHATDIATILGLAGEWPDTVDPDRIEAIVAEVARDRALAIAGRRVAFDPDTDLVFDYGPPLGRHPNAMTFVAENFRGAAIATETWYSVGGGFIEREGAAADDGEAAPDLPHRFASAAQLLAIARATSLPLSAIALANEAPRRPEAETLAFLDHIAAVMLDCMDRGLGRDGVLPGGLKVRRRASGIYARLNAAEHRNRRLPHEIMDYVSTFAMAVNEENAAGGRMVTAPTNGAAGVIPAVLRYHREFCDGTAVDTRNMLLTASLIGDLVKRNASISGAEVGCQGEVGSAAAMAAAALCEVLGGSPQQVVNAAEIGLEHHLGMTCDPIGGLVQVPCIERNGFGAIKAISAASLALHGDGSHFVSLDQVIETMRQTGLDMKSEYRETARGGLAVNVPEC